ncbi:hypothetical protein [Paenibacillus cremeus]|uniref:Uncharacterized protein n=1 Tax=Paenibacillus cremeus TaxID=2163881 RepID=A0A559K628_9BACL|nr:hypothetical protein [Paenibacillus cremeus]TVY07594.1 hypothetical protein FPZ49_22880 [Paenibacillus cremeus]
MKIAIFIILMLMYPLFLHLVHITDLRAIPLIVPYALGTLSVIILGSEIIGLFFRRKKDSE